MEKLKAYSEKSVTEIISNPTGTIRFHNHAKGHPAFKPPYDLSEDDFYQIRFGTSKGGIHGVLIGNIFYVIWLDPQHNMYPDERYGGLRKIIPPMTCCKERDRELDELQKAVIKAQEESQQWQELLQSTYDK